MTPPLDQTDFYKFAGRQGDWLHFGLQAVEGTIVELYGPEGPGLPGPPLPSTLSYAFAFWGSEQTFLLPTNGTWYFAVTSGSLEAWGGASPYVLTFRFSRPTQAFVTMSGEDWQTVEIILPEPMSFVYTARLIVGDAAGPTSLLAVDEIDILLEGFHARGSGGMWVGATGGSDQLIVEPAGIHQSIDLPALHAPVFTGEGGGWTSWDLVSYGARAEGRLRLVGLPINGQVSLSFSADRPFEVASASGSDGVVFWTESNSGAGLSVVSPALSVVGPRTLTLPVEGHTVGMFDSWLHEGVLVEPDGREHGLEFFDSAFLWGLPPGNWGFRMNTTVGAAGLTESPYLTAVRVPLLGLVPDWRDGFVIHDFPELSDVLGLPEV